MERKKKREIARRMASLEKRIQRAKTEEEKAQIEEEMAKAAMDLVLNDTFDFSTMDYIDNYIRGKFDNDKSNKQNT